MYKENLNYKGHDLNSSTVTLDNDHVVQSLHMIKMEYNEDRTSVSMVDDGTGQAVVNNKRDGVVTLQIHKASATNKYLWDWFAADPAGSISIVHTDTNMPDMKSSAPNAYLKTAPAESKAGTPEVIEWTFNEIHLDIKGDGSLKIE